MRHETVCAEVHGGWSSLSRKGGGVYSAWSGSSSSSAEVKQERDMYGPAEVNRSKRLRSAGHCALLVYIMNRNLFAFWTHGCGKGL